MTPTQRTAAERLADVYGRAAECLDYDHSTGGFTWNYSAPTKPNGSGGKRAGTLYLDGYVYIQFDGHRLLAHRLAWVKIAGQLPRSQVDHIDMNRSNNCAANLRLASVTENNRNRRAQSNNTSGHKGVTFHKGTGKYNAKICVNKKRISLGYFASATDAALAYQKAAEEHHVEFARSK